MGVATAPAAPAPGSNGTPAAANRPIGMERGSGHAICGYKLLFATSLWSAYCGQIGLPIVAQVLVNTFRVDGNVLGALQLAAGVIAVFFAAVAGNLQDLGCCGRVFARFGCPRKTWGRRAPPMLLYIPLMSLPLLLAWHPPNWAEVATSVDADHARIPTAEGAFAISTEGLDCATPIAVQARNGTWFFFNSTEPTTAGGEDGDGGSARGGAAVQKSGDLFLHNGTLGLCEALVSDRAFCWPVDEDTRVCSYSDPVVAWWWFFCFVIGMWCFENINAAYKSGSIEIYPWKEERLQLTSLGVVIAILGVSVPVITSGLVQSNSEFGAQPFGNGANTYRWAAAVIACVACFFGLGAVFPLRDARQPTTVAPRSFLREWAELLSTHDAMRWNFCVVVVQQTWGLLQSGLILYYINFVKLVPTEQAGTGYILTVMVGLTTQIVAAGMWGWAFGTTSAEGREKSRNPRNWQLAGTALCVVCNFVAILLDPPTDRDKAGTYRGILIAYALTRVFHSPHDYWWNAVRGWQIDEDCHRLGLGMKRREGTIVAMLNFGVALGSCFVVLLFSFVLVGEDPVCDTRLAAKDVSQTCVDVLWYSFLIGLPLIKCVVFVLVLTHPIRGERLVQLIRRQGEHHQAVDSLGAYKEQPEPTMVKAVIADSSGASAYAAAAGGEEEVSADRVTL